MAVHTPVAWVTHSREWMPVSSQMAGRFDPPVLNCEEKAGFDPKTPMVSGWKRLGPPLEATSRVPSTISRWLLKLPKEDTPHHHARAQGGCLGTPRKDEDEVRLAPNPPSARTGVSSRSSPRSGSC